MACRAINDVVSRPSVSITNETIEEQRYREKKEREIITHKTLIMDFFFYHMVPLLHISRLTIMALCLANLYLRD